MRSFCHAYWRCRVLNRDEPKPVSDTLSSSPSPASNRLVQSGVRRLRLATEYALSVVMVRSSKPRPASNCAFSRLRKNCAASS